MTTVIDKFNLTRDIVKLTLLLKDSKNTELHLSDDRVICDKCARCNLSLILEALFENYKFSSWYPLGILTSSSDSDLPNKCTICNRYLP